MSASVIRLHGNQGLSGLKCYYPERKQFIFEDSELPGLLSHHEPITIMNMNTGVCMEFKFSSVDKIDDEDIAGWNYQSMSGFKLLIIND